MKRFIALNSRSGHVVRVVVSQFGVIEEGLVKIGWDYTIHDRGEYEESAGTYSSEDEALAGAFKRLGLR